MQTYFVSPKLPLKTKASAFCGAPTAMTPAAAATAPVSMARARLSGAGTKAMLFRRQATAAKTHTAARRAMVRTGKGRGKAQSSLQLSKTAAEGTKNVSIPWKLIGHLQVFHDLSTSPDHFSSTFSVRQLNLCPLRLPFRLRWLKAALAWRWSEVWALVLAENFGEIAWNRHVEHWKLWGKALHWGYHSCVACS